LPKFSKLTKNQYKDFCNITLTCSSSVEEFKALKRLLEIEKALANKEAQPSMVQKNRMPKNSQLFSMLHFL